MTPRTAIVLAALALAPLGLASCDKSAPADAPAPAAAAPGAAAIPQTLFVPSIDGEPVAVASVMADAKEGDAVVLHGHIGGRKDPFVAGRAVFTLVDTKLHPCVDDCDTPWDFCCDTQGDIAANAATVQVVGADGAVIKSDIKGLGGVAPGAEIVVAGTVAKREAAGALIVNATGIWVKGG